MPEDVERIPVIEERLRVTKHASPIERVTVRTRPDEEQVIVRDEVRREQVDLVRVPIGREVAVAPSVRTEGDLTIVPILEERIVVEKRLFLVEELHLRRTATVDVVDTPVTLRSTKVDIERETLDPQETE